MYHSIIQTSFTSLKDSHVLPQFTTHFFQAPGDHGCFTLSIILLFPQEYHRIKKSYSVFFQTDFLFINVYLSFLHVFLWLDNSFLFIAGEYSIVGIDQSLFIHSPIEGYLGCFQVLVITSKAPLNICMLFFCGLSFQICWVNS